MPFNPCAVITKLNYFFKPDGESRDVTESLAALKAHRVLLEEHDTIAVKVRSAGHEFYYLDMDTQVRLTFLFMYMACAPNNAMDCLTNWVNSKKPQVCSLLSNNARGFFAYLVSMHISNPLQIRSLLSNNARGFFAYLVSMHMSNPLVVSRPQWWAGAEHKTAICTCIKSSETAPAGKLDALTSALLEHMPLVKTPRPPTANLTLKLTTPNCPLEGTSAIT